MVEGEEVAVVVVVESSNSKRKLEIRIKVLADVEYTKEYVTNKWTPKA